MSDFNTPKPRSPHTYGTSPHAYGTSPHAYGTSPHTQADTASAQAKVDADSATSNTSVADTDPSTENPDTNAAITKSMISMGADPFYSFENNIVSEEITDHGVHDSGNDVLPAPVSHFNAIICINGLPHTCVIQGTIGNAIE